MNNKKERTITYEDLPDTITYLDYAKWRGIGENKAREHFNKKDFPKLKCAGSKVIADKRAVLMYDLNLYENKEFMKGLAEQVRV